MSKETNNKEMSSAISNFGGDFYSILRGYDYKESQRDDVALYGKNNDFPDKLLRLLSDSPFHNKMIKRTVEFIKGEGLELVSSDGSVQLINRPADPITRESWSRVDDRVSADIKIFGGYALKIIWSNDRQSIATVAHVPFQDVRVGTVDEFGRIDRYFVSKYWGRGYTSDKKAVAEEIPMFNPATREQEPLQMLYVAQSNVLSTYYPDPGYTGIINNIIIDKLLNKHKVSFLRNGINAANVIQLVTDLNDKDFQKFVNKLDANLSGAQNSGKNAYLKVPTGQQNFHQITNPNPKNGAEAFNSYFEQNKDIIFMGHDAVYKDIFGYESNQSSLAADRVVEKTVMYHNIVIRPFVRLKEEGYAVIAPFIFPGMTIRVKPKMLFEGLEEARAQIGILPEQSNTAT